MLDPPASPSQSASLDFANLRYLDDRVLENTALSTQRFGIVRKTSIIPSSANKACALISITAGISTSLSAVLSSALRRLIFSGQWAILISYGIAAILSCGVSTASLPVVRCQWKHVVLFIRHRWYNSFVLFSGALGMSQALLAAYIPSHIGIALMVVGMLLGQLTSSLIVDKFGWFWVHQLSISWWSVGGCFILLAGACLYRLRVITGYFSGREESAHEAVVDLVFFIMAIVYGVSKTVQTALNRKLTSLIGARRHVTAWAFMSGTLALLPIALGQSLQPNFSQVQVDDWWKFFAAPFALLAVVAALTGAQYLGFALALCWQVFGQLILSMPLDHFGWLELTRRPLDWMNIMGAIVVLIGVGLTLIGKQKAVTTHRTFNDIMLSVSDLSQVDAAHTTQRSRSAE